MNTYQQLLDLVKKIDQNVVVNGAVGMFLMNHADYKPSTEQTQDTHYNYVVGEINGYTITVDPNRRWSDRRIIGEDGSLIANAEGINLV